jgi:hypothetical protein
MTVNLDIGTELLSGTHFVASTVDADVRFTPEADYAAASGGSQPVAFRAETKGEVAAGAGDLTIIATPVTGWNSATNGDGAIVGRPVDTNEILRERREAQVESAGSATLRAMAADVLDLVEVIDVLPFENVTSVTDANGLPPHSFELVIWDQGLEPNNTIAQTIWDSGFTGIRSYGAESGTAVDENGDDQTVNFSRATEMEVYLEFDLEVDDDFDDVAFKLALVAAADEAFGVGDEVRVAKLSAIALAQDHVIDVVEVRLGFTASPVGTVNLPIGIREIARFETTRVDVTEV